MHHACFFKNVYLPILNGTTHGVHVLSHCPYGFLVNTFIPIVFWVYLTTDMFFSFLKRKAATERPFEVWGRGGVPHFGQGRGTVEKKCFCAAQ